MFNFHCVTWAADAVQCKVGPGLGEMVYRVWFTPLGVNSTCWPSGIADNDDHHSTFLINRDGESRPHFSSDSPQYRRA